MITLKRGRMCSIKMEIEYYKLKAAFKQMSKIPSFNILLAVHILLV